MKVLAANIVFLVAFAFWPKLWDGAFYHLMAAGIFLLFWHIEATAKYGTYLQLFSTIGFWLSLNNLLDELFFDPKAVSVNEYLVALVIVIASIKFFRNGRQQSRFRYTEHY
ncbi:MAG TPA: hypothetical protein VFM18_07750 [Methanosarcina sp.]|nr:hypothetical protein [Methanosarcina sp.]